jgi:dolichyl-phosphate beta-glucosyltransferase
MMPNPKAAAKVKSMLDLSIVIPAYNEAEKIGHDVLAAATFLQENRMTGEVIVVDDGSSDDTAGWAQKVRLPASVTLKVLRLDQNQGKGHAVRTGVLQSIGRVVMFADCGSCIPYPQARDGLALLEKKSCQIAVGSRRSVDSTIVQNQSLYRRLCSVIFRLALRLLLPELRHLDDTQCGFKLYDGALARSLFAQARIDGFLFDVEVLVLALRRGAGICQFPVLWTCDRDSRLSASRHSGSVLRELWAIRKERTGLPDQSGHTP